VVTGNGAAWVADSGRIVQSYRNISIDGNDVPAFAVALYMSLGVRQSTLATTSLTSQRAN